MTGALHHIWFLGSSVQVQERQGWPVAIRNGPNVDNWLGKKSRQEIKSFRCFFVPKRLKGRNISKDAKGEHRKSSESDPHVYRVMHR